MPLLPMESPASHQDLGILLSMLYVAWADDELSASELATLKAEIADQGLDEAEARMVYEALPDPPPPEAIARFLPEPESRLAALSAAYVMAFADASLAVSEMHRLDELARAFSISEAKHERVRALAFRQVQYAHQGRWQEALFLENIIEEPDGPADPLSQ